MVAREPFVASPPLIVNPSERPERSIRVANGTGGAEEVGGRREHQLVQQ
jgi:hypothetical protein